MVDVKNKEGEKKSSKGGEITTAEKQGRDRGKRRVLVVFNTDDVPDKVFPATYQGLEPQHRVVACLVSISTQVKLALDASPAISYDEKDGQVRITRGSKGAKSFRFIFPDSDNKNKLTSYSLAVPGWINLGVFAGSIGKQLEKKGVLKECKGIVTPHGKTYSAKALTSLIKGSEVDDPKNVQDSDSKATDPSGDTQAPETNPSGTTT